MVILLMGVAGSGKTTIGRRLAAGLGWSFLDADDFHPGASVEKMRRGVGLDDADREPWLAALEGAIRERLERGEDAVLACSALKESYRARLLVDGRVRLVYLKGEAALLRLRLEQRPDHFFSSELLRSQLEALEEPEGVLVLDVADSPEAIVRQIGLALGLHTHSAHEEGS